MFLKSIVHGEPSAAPLEVATHLDCTARFVDGGGKRLVPLEEDHLVGRLRLCGAIRCGVHPRQRQDGVVQLFGGLRRCDHRALRRLGRARCRCDSKPVRVELRGRGQDRLIELLPEGDRPLPNLRFARDGHRPAAFAFCHHGRHDGGSLEESQGVMRAELSGADPIRGKLRQREDRRIQLPHQRGVTQRHRR